ncbi:MAG: aldehyde dehydrogenase family protein [Cyclobacteriaceae bacterium]|nr:aldehyde dehydrogenase family protein [Cyclobacteriaceae bacterium]MCH8515502.1 aldehyde dehydrogenase family protein [Cyclobacteriaceae bacterium]
MAFTDLKPTTTTNEYQSLFDAQKKMSIQMRTIGVGNRKEKLKKLQKWIESHRDEIKHALSEDFKKPETETEMTEIFPSLSELKHAQKNIEQWTAIQEVSNPPTLLGANSYIIKEPKGTALLISPWNYPFYLAVSPLVSAISAGCTAMMKPSEFTPSTSHLIKQMVTDIFHPDEVSVVEGGIEASQKLLSLPFDHIFFTGSPQVGKKIMAAASEHLTSVTLELGGKSPAVIAKDADLKDAVDKITWGKLINAGQTCIAPDYLFVHESQEEEAINLIKAKVRKFYGVDPASSQDLARIISQKHAGRMQELINDCVSKGAEIVLGGDVNITDRYVSPTLVKNLKPNMKILEEEIFGPILPILTYGDIQDVIDYINARPKPLALYFFSQSIDLQNKIIKSCSSGGMCMNDTVMHLSNHDLPFGGVNTSGIGKSHGYHGFLEFTNEKAVLKQRIGFTATKVLYPPYRFTTKKLSGWLSKLF